MTSLSITSFNIDLLTVGLSAAAIGILGVITFLNDKRSPTARSFLLFAMLTVLWNITNYFQYQFTTVPATLLALRINLFVATWHAFSFFLLAFFFGESCDTRLPRWVVFVALPLAAFVSVLTLTPLVFKDIVHLAPLGYVTNPERGPGIALFTIVAFGYLIWGVAILYRKWRAATERVLKNQILTVWLGMTVTALLILCFNVLLPLLFNTLAFLPYTGVFMLPFIAIVSYAIYRLHLFHFKVIAVESLVFILGGVTFIEVVFTTSPLLVVARTIFFVLIVVTGILLTRSVMREVEQRERIQRLAEELKETNERQETLIHFIGHEVKGYLTKAEGAFSELAEGDFGKIEEGTKDFVNEALRQTREGVASVSDILKAANLKKGTVSFKKEPFDLAALAEEAVAKARPAAEAKDLALSFTKEEGSYAVVGDAGKIAEHVLRNLIDNAVAYTSAGSVAAALAHEGGKLVFSVKDTGVGIAPEDKARLFTEGGHGKESQKVNVHSTGYGLYIAKQVAEAHGGTIRAESDGPGKGATFVVELPAAA